MSIRSKLFGAFLFAVFSAAALAAVALLATWSLGDLTQRLYDQPLQAINHARSAQTAFAILSRSASAQDQSEYREQILSDLSVVRERVQTERVRELITKIETELASWWAMAAADQNVRIERAKADEVQLLFEILAEAAASGGYRFWLEAEQIIETTKNWTLGVILGVLVMTMLVAFLLSRNILLPMSRMEKAMTDLADGDRDITVPALERRDEIGDMAKALQIFKTAMNEIEAARERAEAATKAKSEFLAMMSHEIRTPMSGVIGMARMLVAAPLEDREKEAADTLLESSESLMVILNDILDFSKLEAGQFDLEEVDFSPQRLVESSVALMTGRAIEKDLSLGAQVADEVPVFLRGDPGRLRQVLLNLLSNAIKFTDSGEVAITLTCGTPSGDQVNVILSVRDTGIGMDGSAKAKLFREFSQADASIAGKYGGTGLGLNISKRIVEQMGGAIEVESAPGVGTTFSVHVTLPVGQETAEDQLDSSIDLPPLNILVAEDNTVIQKVILWLLDYHGHNATIVDNGKRAVEAVSNGDFDLVLMDLHMPEMNGLDATLHIREIEPGLPILATTAGASERDLQTCMDAGMNGHVRKPIQPDDLFREISRTVFDGDIDGFDDDDGPDDVVAQLSSGSEPFEPSIFDTLVDQLGAELVLELVEAFHATADASLANIQTGDAEIAADSAHSLKSAAGSLGLRAVWQISEKIENDAGANNMVTAEADVTLLASHLGDARDYLDGKVGDLTAV